MGEVVEGGLEALLVPTGVALGAKEDRSLVIINPVNVPTLVSEVDTNFGTNESRGAGN